MIRKTKLTSQEYHELVWIDLVWLFVLAISLRMLFIIAVRPIIFGELDARTLDPDLFGARAVALLEGRGFINLGTNQPETARDPLYTYLIAAVWALTGEQVVVIQVLNAVLGGLATALAYALACTAFGRAAGIWSGLLFAVFPLNIWYSPLYRYEALTAPLVALAGFLSLRLHASLRWVTAVFLGIVLGLIALTISVYLLLPGILLLWALLQPNRLALLSRLGVSFACMVLVMLPWIYSSSQAGRGEQRLARSGSGLNFWLGVFGVEDYHLAPMQLTPLRKNAQRRIAEMITVQTGVAATPEMYSPQQDQWLEQAILPWILAHPGEMVRKQLLQTLRFWYLADSRGKTLFILSIQLPLLILAGAGMVVGLRRRQPIGMFVLIIAIINLAYAFFWVEARYTVTLEPYVMSLAGLGLAGWRPLQPLIGKVMRRYPSP